MIVINMRICPRCKSAEGPWYKPPSHSYCIQCSREYAREKRQLYLQRRNERRLKNVYLSS